MASYNKQFLSNSINGKQIGINQSTSPGATIHVGSSVATDLDEVYVYAANNGSTTLPVVMQWGGSTASDIITTNVPANSGRVLLTDGKLLTTGQTASLYVPGVYSTAITVDGFVNRISQDIDPRIVDWANRVVRNGGASPSTTTQNALTYFVKALTATGIMKKIVSMIPFVPDSLIAAATPIIPGWSFDPWTITNFVSGDLSVNGLTGNGSSKWLNTGMIPSASGILTSTNAGMTAYVYDNSASVSGYAMGSAGSANSSHFALFLSDASGTKSDGFIWRFVNVGTDWVQGNKPSTGGYFSVNRTSATQIDMYFGNSLTPHFDLATGTGTTQTGSIITDQAIYAYAFNNVGGGPASFSASTFSFMAIHQGLTATESQLFFNAIQNLRVMLGGGYR